MRLLWAEFALAEGLERDSVPRTQHCRLSFEGLKPSNSQVGSVLDSFLIINLHVEWALHFTKLDDGVVDSEKGGNQVFARHDDGPVILA